MDAHPCNWECAVLTFVCPSGSPHTQWWAALRLIGHSDKKYQPTNHPFSHSDHFLLLNVQRPIPGISVTQNLQAFPKVFLLKPKITLDQIFFCSQVFLGANCATRLK